MYHKRIQKQIDQQSDQLEQWQKALDDLMLIQQEQNLSQGPQSAATKSKIIRPYQLADCEEEHEHKKQKCGRPKVDSKIGHRNLGGKGYFSQMALKATQLDAILENEKKAREAQKATAREPVDTAEDGRGWQAQFSQRLDEEQFIGIADLIGLSQSQEITTTEELTILKHQINMMAV